MSEQIRRVLVWSGWLRVAHWSLAAATLTLLASGWLVANAPSVANGASDLHYLAASVLIFALALRLFLGVVGKGVERFEQLLPRDNELHGMRDSLLFYLSLGKAPRPNWYAHNPLWKPFYLLLLLLLLGLALSGWLMPDRPLLGHIYLPHAHQWMANAVAVLTLAHLYSVFLQDLKGETADISAMVNGQRYFSVDRDTLIRPEVPKVSVSLTDLAQKTQQGSQRKE